MLWTNYIVTLLISSFTGWLCLWIAFKLLFHPVKPANIAGFKLQGAFPANQQMIGDKIGRLSSEFLSPEFLKEKVATPEIFQKLKPEIEKHIDVFLKEKLKEVFPMLSMFIGEKTIGQLKAAFLTELESLFPALMNNYISSLQEDLNIEKLVAEKINGLSSQKLEALIGQPVKNKMLSLGLFIGFMMGIVQVLISILINL